MRALVRTVLAAVVAAGVGAVGFAEPAAARDYCKVGWSSEQEMMNDPGAYCRSTWMVDPGVGNLLSRQQLLEHAALFEHYGFTRQWMMYARETTITVPAGSNQEWSSCPASDTYTGACPIAAGYDHHVLLRNFAPGVSVTLHVFEYDGAFIPRACGNFWHPVPSFSNPVPWVDVSKFDDRNRNGGQDAGEGPLGGWSFQVHRMASWVGQPTGQVGTVTTDGNGSARFAFDGQGPGTYRVDEVGQDGWAATTATSRTFDVAEGIGSVKVAELVFGNAQTRADLVKVHFDLIDAPQRLDAGQDADLTVRAVLRNDGPADVTARDSLAVAVPGDCTASPVSSAVDRVLARGQEITVDFPVKVRCDQPSFHPMTFTDHLDVATPGVEDPNLADNTVAFEHVFPVFGDADIRTGQTTVVCPPRSDVDEQFSCTVTTPVVNAGPFGPVNVDVVTQFQAPSDCTAVSDSPNTSLSLPADATVTASSVWAVTCHQRSNHPMTATVTATLNQLHVEDHVAGNSVSTATTVPEIFQPADLAVTSLGVRCTEREANATASDCTGTAVVTNAGPATGVAITTAFTIAVAEGCHATVDGSESHDATLNSGANTTVTTHWQITCPTADRHTVRVSAAVRTDEPHAEDRNTANNATTTVWNPVDVKPRSLPSSVNIGKEGVIPFAVLSTADLNAMTDVRRDSLRFGATGTEASVVSCAPDGEDVNGDGRFDLVCKAEAQQTGIQCTTEVALLSGQLTSGVRLEGEDAVKVVGCRR